MLASAISHWHSRHIWMGIFHIPRSDLSSIVILMRSLTQRFGSAPATFPASIPFGLRCGPLSISLMRVTGPRESPYPLSVRFWRFSKGDPTTHLQVPVCVPIKIKCRTKRCTEWLPVARPMRTRYARLASVAPRVAIGDRGR